MSIKPSPNAPRRRPRLLFLGAFPPPIHGASLINQCIEKKFNEAGNDVERLDLVGPWWSEIHFRPLFLLLKTMNVVPLWFRFLWLVLRPGQRILYVSTAGGYGKTFELPFLLIARFLRLRIWYHHHNFQYLEHPRTLARTAFLLGGKKAHHITLCAYMRTKLCDLYGIDRERTHVLSNSGLLLLPTSPPVVLRERIHTLGFLSNISFAKGIRHFIELCEVLQREKIDYHARIAGPCMSPEVEAYVTNATQRLPNLDYLGPCHGEAKTTFLDSIDLLVFPSHYEAEPLVIHEANSRGVYVFATDRGCIAEVLKSAGGEVLDTSRFVEHAVRRIIDLQQHPDLVQELSRTSVSSMAQRNTASQQALQTLLGALA